VQVLAQAPDRSRTIRELADEAQVPADYLSKVMRQLSRTGIVSAQRGKKGGFRLARALDQVSLHDVSEAVAPFTASVDCPVCRALPASTCCSLHAACNEALEAYHTRLRATRLVDVVVVPTLAPTA
jgi:Rrf2 family protein